MRVLRGGGSVLAARARAASRKPPSATAPLALPLGRAAAVQASQTKCPGPTARSAAAVAPGSGGTRQRRAARQQHRTRLGVAGVEGARKHEAGDALAQAGDGPDLHEVALHGAQAGHVAHTPARSVHARVCLAVLRAARRGAAGLAAAQPLSPTASRLLLPGWRLTCAAGAPPAGRAPAPCARCHQAQRATAPTAAPRSARSRPCAAGRTAQVGWRGVRAAGGGRVRACGGQCQGGQRRLRRRGEGRGARGRPGARGLGRSGCRLRGEGRLPPRPGQAQTPRPRCAELAMCMLCTTTPLALLP